jgi:HTH-type transcriptional regulator/antitoxin HigA
MAAKQTGLSPELLIHPGETLREVIENRNMNQKELALRTGFSEKQISKVLNGKCPIRSQFAMALETALGIDAMFWLNLQANYDIESSALNQTDTVEAEEIDILLDLKQIAAYWQKSRILPNCDDKRERVLQLRNILGVKNLTIIPDLQFSAAFRTSTSNAANPYVLFAWMKMCEMAVTQQILSCQLNTQLLRDSLQSLKNLMFADVRAMQKKLTQILGKCGIKFGIVPNFRGAPIQGFIRKNDNEEMVLCMTIRQKFADIFWFSFFHEVGHILNGDVLTHFIDYSEITDERERRADEFAKEVLIPTGEYKNFLEKGDFSLGYIEKFAASVDVPPYIVIGRLQKEKLLPYSRFSREKPRFEWV